MAFQSTPTVSLAATSHNQAMAYSRLFRENSHLLTTASYNTKLDYLLNHRFGLSEEAAVARKADLDEETEKNPMPSGMMDPSQMMAGFTQNFTVVLPNMLQMAWVSYFFDGFVAAKFPFPLLDKFKVMLQRGVDIRTIDASYISSLSWYLLCMFSLRSIYTLVLGDGAKTGDDEASFQQLAMPMAGAGLSAGAGMGAGSGAAQYGSLYKNERAELEAHAHHDKLGDSEQRLIEMWLKKQSDDNKQKID